MAGTGSPNPEQRGTVALLAAAISAAAIALPVLFGWVLGAPAFTAWGSDALPMAPSTAALAVLFGAALALAPWPSRSWTVRLGTLIGWLGAVSALVLFLLRLRGEYWPVEHLGFRISGTFRGAAVGYISPVTALSFLLANVVLVIVLPPGARGSWRRRLAWGVGGLISVTSFALLLAHAFGAPLLFRGTFIPPALNTSLILLIVGLALLVLAGRLYREPRVPPEGVPHGRFEYFLVIFVAFAALTIGAGYGYYRQEEQAQRGEAERHLDVVAKLKVTEVSHWRRERVADATVMLHSAFLSASFKRFLQKPGDTAIVRQLQEWLGSYQAYGQYDRAFLIDAHGATRLSLPALAEPPSATISRQASEVLRTGQVALQDFYLDERDQRGHLAILAPIIDRSVANRPIAVLVLRIDPDAGLYPSIESWPTTSTTAEALLVRRDGADVLHLSNLRFDSNAALRKRIPLENTRVLAVKAALGQTGAADGVDYRGVASLGALYPIPDSPWYLIARIDIAEFSAQLWDRMWLITALTIVLLSGEGLGLSLIGRNQRTRFYQKRAQLTSALKESEERLRLALSATDQGLYDLNVQTGEAVVSPEYATMLGYDPAEFHESNAAWIERMHPDDREPVVAAFQGCLAGRRDEYCVEFRQRTKSGDWMWILSLGKVVSRGADGQPLRMLGTRTNITARKAAEAALRTSLLEKEALLREVHHRVKNNLQVITSLLRLEAGRNGQAAVRTVLAEMQNRIQSMALMHETLYRSGNLAQVDLSVYLTQLATQLFRSAAPSSGAIALHMDVASACVNLEQAVPCGLLVNELVSNCLKHGFPDGRTGEVRIALERVDERAHPGPGRGGQVRLQVSDTGVGLPAGLEQRRAGSLGLQLVSDLARQLRGTLDIGCGPGALFSLVFTPDTSAASPSEEK